MATKNIWPRRRSNLVMGISAVTMSAMAVPTVRQQVHDMLHIKEEDQVIFDVLVVGAATTLGLYSLYQMGRFDATNFILSPPEHGSKSWYITEGGTRKNPRWAWEVSVVDPKVVNVGA